MQLETDQVLVYGTLKRAYGNHRLMVGGSEFLREVDVRGHMVDLGGIPGVRLDKEGVFRAELHKITDPDVWKRMDRLEGYCPDDESQSFYNRRLVTVDDDGSQAYVYEYNNPKLNDMKGVYEWSR